MCYHFRYCKNMWITTEWSLATNDLKLIPNPIACIHSPASGSEWFLHTDRFFGRKKNGSIIKCIVSPDTDIIELPPLLAVAFAWNMLSTAIVIASCINYEKPLLPK